MISEPVGLVLSLLLLRWTETAGAGQGAPRNTESTASASAPISVRFPCSVAPPAVPSRASPSLNLSTIIAQDEKKAKAEVQEAETKWKEAKEELDQAKTERNEAEVKLETSEAAVEDAETADAKQAANKVLVRRKRAFDAAEELFNAAKEDYLEARKRLKEITDGSGESRSIPHHMPCSF